MEDRIHYLSIIQLNIHLLEMFAEVDAHHIVEQTRAEQQRALSLHRVRDVAAHHCVTRVVQRAHHFPVGRQLHDVRRREVERECCQSSAWNQLQICMSVELRVKQILLVILK